MSHLTAFRDAKEAAGEDCHLTFTAFELYNERLLDLTTDSSPDPAGLRVADDPRRGAWPRGAAEIALREGVDASALLRRANARRAVGATGLNPDSSRSHLIVALCLETRDAFSKLFLVDLAGCEKAKRTGAEGSRLDEACGINKSLSALGNVVAALAANSESATNTTEASESSSEAARHVPYRDSKLTRVLREALGGDARATLVTCLSPSVADREESLSTLRFGARARKIAKPPPRRRTKGDGRGPPGRVLQEEALRLRAECLGLRAELDAARRELGELRRNREEEVRDARAVVDRAEAAMAAAVTTEAKAAAKAAGLAAGRPAGSPRRGGRAARVRRSRRDARALGRAQRRARARGRRRARVGGGTGAAWTTGGGRTARERRRRARKGKRREDRRAFWRARDERYILRRKFNTWKSRACRALLPIAPRLLRALSRRGARFFARGAPP